MNNALRQILGIGFGLASSTAFAEGVSINGFLTTSVARTDTAAATYLNSFTDEARFDNTDSRLGLQFSGAINKHMSATAQLLARGRGGNNAIETDWAFVSIDAAKQTQLRAGKLKFPTFLISDYYEVGYAYPWIRPPQEVYALNPISTLVGIDALYTPVVGKANLLIQPFVGSNRGTAYTTGQQDEVFSAAPFNLAIAAGHPINFNAPMLAGLNTVLNFSSGSFRLGYLQAEVDADMNGDGLNDIDGKTAGFASAGFTVDWSNVVVYAEYADRDSAAGAMETAFPDQRAGYLTLGYRFGKFLPHVTYASLDEGADESPTVLKQTSTTLGLRYEFLEGAALKFEYQAIDPDEGNSGLFSADVEDANLYGMSLDVTF
jgi:hypothetical protein